MSLRRLLARRRRANDMTAAPAPPIYIYPGLLRTAPARAVLLDALCPAAPYGPHDMDRPSADGGGRGGRGGSGDRSSSTAAAAACCPICFDDFAENSLVRTLYCSHQYHSQCLLSWLLKGYAARCPMCAASLSLPVACVADDGAAAAAAGAGGGTIKNPNAACARALVRAPAIAGPSRSSPSSHIANVSVQSLSSQDLAMSMITPIVHLPEAGVGIQTLCAVPPGELDSDMSMRSYCYMEHDLARFSKNLP